MIPRQHTAGKGQFSRFSLAISGRRPTRQERRETTPRRLQPVRQIALEPLEPEPRSQHLMGNAPLGLAIMLQRREPRGLNRKTALRT
jgi:hypothetical protein